MFHTNPNKHSLSNLSPHLLKQWPSIRAYQNMSSTQEHVIKFLSLIAEQILYSNQMNFIDNRLQRRKDAIHLIVNDSS